MKNNKEYFPDLQYNHCIAYAKFIEDLINFLCNESNAKKYKIMLDDARFYFHDKVDLGIRKLSHYHNTRVGNHEWYWTHCYEFDVNCDEYMIDGDLCKTLQYCNDYSEELFFQNSLLYKNCDLFYVILFNYLKMNLQYSFSVYDAPIPEIIFQYFPNLLDIAIKKDYYNDLIELMDNIQPKNR